MNLTIRRLIITILWMYGGMGGIISAAPSEPPERMVQGGGYDGWDINLSAATRLDGPNVLLSSGSDQVLSALADSAALATLTLTESDNAYPALTNGAVLTLAFPDGWDTQWNTNTMAYGGDAVAKVAWPTPVMDGRRLQIAVTADFTAGETLVLSGLAVDKLPVSRQGAGRLRLDYSGDGLWNVYDAYTLTVHMVWSGGNHDGWDIRLSAPYTLDGPNVRLSSDSDQVLSALADSTGLAVLTLIESDNAYLALTNGAVLTLAFPDGLDLRWNLDALSYGGAASGKVAWPTLAQNGHQLEITVIADFAADETLTLTGLWAENVVGSRQGVGRIRLDYNGDGIWNVYDDQVLTVHLVWPGGNHDGWDADRSQAVKIYPLGSMFMFR